MVSPPQSPFQPVLPALPDLKFLGPSRSKFTPVPEFKPIEPVKREPEFIHIEETIAEETEPSSQEAPAAVKEDVDDAVSSAFEEDNLPQLSSPLAQERLSVRQKLVRLLVWGLIATSAFATWNYKVESASIGFCDRGSNTNKVLNMIKTRRAAAIICNREGQPTVERPSLDDPSTNLTEACPLPPLLPLPVPSSCTPCPEHASCTQHSVTCDTGYLLKPHLLLSVVPVLPSQTSLTTRFAPHLYEFLLKGVSTLCDGLFGSIAFPPRCVEDPRRKRHIGNLGKAIEARLAKERGRRVCRGDRIDPSEPEESPEQAVKWGVEIGKLKTDFKKTANVSQCIIGMFRLMCVQPVLYPVFDDMFNEAIQQLTQWGGVFVGETSE
jgi:hypothetical protein